MAGDPARMSAADIEAARQLAASFPAISDESVLRARAARLASAVRRMAAELKQAEAERDALKAARCPSCDHLTTGHQQDGCWYAVTTGTAGRDLVCPCTVPTAALDHPTDTTGDTNRGVLGRILTVRQDVDRRLHRALFGDPPRTGVRVINDQMADDYDPPSTSVNPRPADPTACQGCADSLAKCRADGGRCCDLCQHPTDTTGETDRA